MRSATIVTASLILASTIAASMRTTTPKKTQAATQRKPARKASRAESPATLQLEPKAVEILKAASGRLAAAKTMTFVAVETFESLSRQGAPLAYAHRSEVALQRPDKLRVILTGDGPRSEFYYDGKAIMAYAPEENAVAVTDAPPTIDQALESIYHKAAVYFPFTDLIVADPYADLAPGLKHAYYVGQSTVVGGTTTDIVAYNGDGVFAQVWIGVDDKLPRLVHAIYLDDPNELRHNLVLSDWTLDSTLPSDHFTSSKAGAARRMDFAHPAMLRLPTK